MTPLPRGTCPVCGHEVALRKGGLIREHHFRISTGPPAFSQPAGERVKCGPFASGCQVCTGAGRPSVEEIERELDGRYPRGTPAFREGRA